MFSYSKKVQLGLSEIDKAKIIKKYNDKKIAMIISILYNNLENCFSPINPNDFVIHIGTDLWIYFWNYYCKNSKNIDSDTFYIIKQLFYEPIKKSNKIKDNDIYDLITERQISNDKSLSFILPNSISEQICIYSGKLLIEKIFISKNGFSLKSSKLKLDLDSDLDSDSDDRIKYRTKMKERSTKNQKKFSSESSSESSSDSSSESFDSDTEIKHRTKMKERSTKSKTKTKSKSKK
jgi:hypothetical protein